MDLRLSSLDVPRLARSPSGRSRIAGGDEAMRRQAMHWFVGELV